MDDVYLNVFNLLQDTQQVRISLSIYSTILMLQIRSFHQLDLSRLGIGMKTRRNGLLVGRNQGVCAIFMELVGLMGLICNTYKSPICRCLKGFVPKSSDEWSKGNWTGGCVRRTELLCDEKTSDRRKNDGFGSWVGRNCQTLMNTFAISMLRNAKFGA